MLDELVGDAHAVYVGMVSVVSHELQYGTSEASLDGTVLEGDDMLELTAHLVEYLFVDRLEETHIVMGGADALGCHAFHGFGSEVAYGADAEYGDVVTIVQLASLAYGQLFEGAVPVDQFAASAGIAYGEGTLVGELGRIHQVAQLMLIVGRRDGEVRYGAQEGEVEGTMVCGAIFAYQSATVDAEHHVEAADGHVVYDIVVGTLQERRVDVAEGYEPVLGHTSREGHCVALGNAYIEAAAGELLHHDVERAACGHGGGYAYDALVLLGQFEQRMSEHILETGRLALVVSLEALARLGVEQSGCMPLGGGLLGRGETSALDGVYVEHLGTVHILDGAQHAHQGDDVVPVHRAEVADVHSLKHVLLLGEERLHAVVESDETLAPAILHQTQFVEHLRKAVAPLVVAGCGGESQEVSLESAHRAVDGHLVVVEHDEHVVVALRHIV